MFRTPFIILAFAFCAATVTPAARAATYSSDFLMGTSNVGNIEFSDTTPGGITALSLTFGGLTFGLSDLCTSAAPCDLFSTVPDWSIDTGTGVVSGLMLALDADDANGTGSDTELLLTFDESGPDLATFQFLTSNCDAACAKQNAARNRKLSLQLRTSNLQVASAEVTATPLPAAIPFFLTMLGGMGFLKWRRERRQAA